MLLLLCCNDQVVKWKLVLFLKMLLLCLMFVDNVVSIFNVTFCCYFLFFVFVGIIVVVINIIMIIIMISIISWTSIANRKCLCCCQYFGWCLRGRYCCSLYCNFFYTTDVHVVVVVVVVVVIVVYLCCSNVSHWTSTAKCSLHSTLNQPTTYIKCYYSSSYSWTYSFFVSCFLFFCFFVYAVEVFIVALKE